MKTALVMGGTTFFGKCLVRHLLKDDYDVTVATRGLTADAFGDQIDRIRFDRNDGASMEQAFEGKQYDIVFDQIGYCADDLADACKVFTGSIGHYVSTSSIVVYEACPGVGKVEEEFDPLNVSCSKGRFPDDIDYTQGKMEAEAYLAQNAAFPFVCARIPMVMGPGDPTDRMEFIVRRILAGRPIVIPPDSGLRNYVHWDDAGRFVAWLGTTSRTGAYNAGSERWVGPREMTILAGSTLGIEPVILDQGDAGDQTDYAGGTDYTVDVSKAKQDGFEFTAFDQWYPRVVEETAQIIKRESN